MKTFHKKSRQKIVICISGMTGCGKSTLAKKLAEKYELKYHSGGDALKSLAIESGYKPAERGWWETTEGMRFLQQRMRDLKFDRAVDEKLFEWAKEGNVVLDSWTMPWLLKDGFKIWIEVSLEERARRLAKRDAISLEEAFNIIREKDEKTKMIYKSLYGFNLGEDFSPFNLILDANELNADEVFRAICMVLDRLVLEKWETASQKQ
mgnify:CR=1 FL=1